MEWKIYYGDNTTYGSNQGSPESANGRNVMCIVQTDKEVGRFITARCDYFWFDKIWHGGDIFGLFDYLVEPGFKKVLFGRTIPSDEYEEIIKTALSDPDFPIKSAKLPKEKF